MMTEVTNLPCPVGFGLPTHPPNPPVGLVYCDVSDVGTIVSDMVATMRVSIGNAMQRSQTTYYMERLCLL